MTVNDPHPALAAKPAAKARHRLARALCAREAGPSLVTLPHAHISDVGFTPHGPQLSPRT
jgi:hypothetical protein